MMRFTVPLVATGFVAVGLSAYFLGRGAAMSSPATAPSHAEHTEEEEHGTSGVITLTPDAIKTAGIRVEPARSALRPDVLHVPGTVEVRPGGEARITPPVPGRVVRLFAGPGDAVRRKQPLAVLDSVEAAGAHAAVEQAQAAVRQAEAQVQTARAGVRGARVRQGGVEAALARQRELARTGAFSQPSLQAAQNEMNEAQGEEAQAQNALGAADAVLTRAERLFREELVARSELEQAQNVRRQETTRLERAAARVAIAKQALAREQTVFRGGLLAKQAVQSAQAALRAARGDVRQAEGEEQAARTALAGARSGLSGARTNLRALEGDGHTEGGAGRITLYATISGTVTERRVTLGQAVERGAEMFVIEDLSAVVVEARVPEASVARVRVGQPVEVMVAAYPQARFAGVVQSIGGRVDEKTRALPVRCLVRNPGARLKPEMFAEVALAVGGGNKSVLAVPASAVAEDGNERFVFVKARGGFEKRDVRVGRTMGGRTEIVSGVGPGESIVVEGVFVLKSEGAKDELKGHEH